MKFKLVKLNGTLRENKTRRTILKAETIGQISGIIVMVSAIPYIIRVYQRKIPVNLISWIIWSMIGWTILITFKDSGATNNIWPAIFGAISPTIITLLAWWRGTNKEIDGWDIACGVIGIIAIVLWALVRNEPSKVQFALYLALIADTCAGVPIFTFVWNNPHADRPFAWGMFGIGYGLSIFAITEHTFANYALPVYMLITASAICSVLCVYRIKNRLPVMEWI